MTGNKTLGEEFAIHWFCGAGCAAQQRKLEYDASDQATQTPPKLKHYQF